MSDSKVYGGLAEAVVQDALRRGELRPDAALVCLGFEGGDVVASALSLPPTRLDVPLGMILSMLKQLRTAPQYADQAQALLHAEHHLYVAIVQAQAAALSTFNKGAP